MTNSSSVYVKKVKDMLEEQGKSGKFLLMCGGAAANKGIASEMGVSYGLDANAAVALVMDHVANAA